MYTPNTRETCLAVAHCQVCLYPPQSVRHCCAHTRSINAASDRGEYAHAPGTTSQQLACLCAVNRGVLGNLLSLYIKTTCCGVVLGVHMCVAERPCSYAPLCEDTELLPDSPCSDGNQSGSQMTTNLKARRSPELLIADMAMLSLPFNREPAIAHRLCQAKARNAFHQRSSHTWRSCCSWTPWELLL